MSCKKEKLPPTIVPPDGNYEVLQKTEFWQLNGVGDTLTTVSSSNGEVVDVQVNNVPFQIDDFATINGELYKIKQFVYEDYQGKPWVHQLWLERYVNIQYDSIKEGDVLSYHLGKYK